MLPLFPLFISFIEWFEIQNGTESSVSQQVNEVNKCDASVTVG